ncbi:hypothetical protein [Ruficoccus sp. ZRK36]|uniref:hypothetical protein n=1 Tax=Ruficoccus sp. ZRK36 TaxID=2866311 RepID=UPI001C737676|nr:hypothetical protein [Ruficoccus sp. ZRK36]QYY36892.1 hypothetical protein K0V07_05295 [Ruficoccus sp. ZRK36]
MKKIVHACLITSLLTASSVLSAQTIFSDNFNSGGFSGYDVTPTVSDENRGVVIVDEESTPANPFSGNAARVYDLSTASVFLENDYTSTASTQLVQLFTFDAALAVGSSTTDGVLSFRLTNEGGSTSSKDNCVFDIQLRQTGVFYVYGATSNGFSNVMDTSGVNIAVYTNSSTSSITLTDMASNELTLGAREFAVYIDGENKGIWGFRTGSTYDPTEGIGRFGFVSSSSATGSDVIIDNIEISAIPEASTSALMMGAAIAMFLMGRKRFTKSAQ